MTCKNKTAAAFTCILEGLHSTHNATTIALLAKEASTTIISLNLIALYDYCALTGYRRSGFCNNINSACCLRALIIAHTRCYDSSRSSNATSFRTLGNRSLNPYPDCCFSSLDQCKPQSLQQLQRHGTSTLFPAGVQSVRWRL